MLIIFGGLPGSGKTTVARALAKRLGAVYVRVDTIEQAIRVSGGDPVGDIGPAGYVVAYGVAEDNLTLGRVVIADSVNPLRITRDAWLAVAARSGVLAVEVEVICSDKIEHRRRAETRKTDVGGLVKPTWQETVEREYDDWGQRPIIVDTAAKDVPEIVEALIVKLRTDRLLPI
ncbi:putative kinase [Rhizobium leguminosarum bv. trifolii WSM597]|uniref:Putative kinase n=1 Tax=Rhizobium leguminosarum bv. trifolii WSM597 TaxID=754764 RepID=I9N3I8_RHILT|nr:AAA family ATPase [Rhizobium leguminosarum]EJB02434.1 putative kinase [Rhizobium leguminosarum bv. trifolii WSM597]EJB08429.1 putative kinase [Rhizobium leguminosarum bv. trifolii WSM597]